MADTHPPDLDESLAEARRHVRRKRILYTVIAIWIAFCPMWFAIDMLDDSSSIWSYWPMLGTGTGVLITAIVLLGIGGLFSDDWERREEAKYLRRRPTSPATGAKFAVPRGRLVVAVVLAPALAELSAARPSQAKGEC